MSNNRALNAFKAAIKAHVERRKNVPRTPVTNAGGANKNLR